MRSIKVNLDMSILPNTTKLSIFKSWASLLGIHLFFGKSRKNSLQQFGIQLGKFRNLTNLAPSTRKYTRSGRTWHRGLHASPRLSACAKPVGLLLPRAGRNFIWSPHARRIIIDAAVLSARVHGISRSADSGVHRYVGQLTILVGQLTIAIVIQRHDSWPTTDHAGREGRLEVEDYSPSCEEQASSLALQGAGRLLDHAGSRDTPAADRMVRWNTQQRRRRRA